MKNIIGILCLSFLSLQVFAQDTDSLSKQYDQENWRVLFQMNGPNNWQAAINFAKPISPKWVLRFGLSPIIAFNRTIGDNPNSEEFKNYDLKSKNVKMGAKVSFGAEFHIIQKGKIDPYILFGSGMGGFKEINKRTTAYELNIPSPSGQVSYDRSEVSKSAPQLYLNPFAGFGVNYFFHKRLAFGIEYSLSPDMVLVKGESKSIIETKEIFDDGSNTLVKTDLSIDRNSFSTNLNQQIGFHLIYILNKKN